MPLGDTNDEVFWGGLPPPPPHIFCRPLPRPPRKIMENPWVPMGPMGSPWGPMGSPWGPMGSPWDPWKIQECLKSWILMKTTIRFDRKLETRGPDRCAIFFRSILSRQNPLNRHMEQNILFGPKIQFFEFFGLESPYRTRVRSGTDSVSQSRIGSSPFWTC